MHIRDIKSVILLLAVIGIFISTANAQDTTAKSNVAVMNLRADGALSEATSILSDRLRNELFNTGRYLVMERGEMDNILKEQGFQQSGVCDDKACMVEAGQLLGVDKIIAGSIGQIGTKYLINLRIIDVRTGKMMDTYSGECTCPMEELAGAMKTAAERLGNKNSIVLEKKPEAEKRLSKHTIGISGNSRDLSSTINSFLKFMETEKYADTSRCFIKPEGSNTSAQFGQGAGISLAYNYRLREKLHINISIGSYRQKLDATYDIIRKPPAVPRDAGKLTVSSDLILSPLKVGASWSFFDRNNIRLRADAALAFTSLIYTIDFGGIYKHGIAQVDSIGSWLDMSSGTLGFTASLEFIYKINKQLNFGIDAGFERTNFATLSGNGNMDALTTILSKSPGPLPSDQSTSEKYTMVQMETNDKEQWTIAVKDTQQKETSIALSSAKLGITLYYNFLSREK